MTLSEGQIRSRCRGVIVRCKNGNYTDAAKFALAHDLELLTIADYVCEATRLTDYQFHMLSKKYHEIDNRTHDQPVLKPSTQI